MLACERGETTEAARLFEHIESHFDPPVGIRALITNARARLCPSSRLPAGRMAAGIGWSSNVNLGPSQTSYLLPGTTPLELRVADRLLPRPDGHVVVEAERNFPFGAGQLTAFGTFRRNFSARDFDEGLFGIAYRIPEIEAAGGRWGGSATLAHTWLSGARYADHRRLDATFRWSGFTLAAHWQSIDYPQAPVFDARQMALRAGAGARWGDWRIAARIGRLVDAAVSTQRPGGDRSGWLADLQANRPGPGSSLFEVAWRGEWSRSQRPYLPGFFDMHRNRRFAQFEVAWQIPHDAETSWRLGCVMTRTHESVPLLGYRQTTVGASWIRVFR